MDILEQDLASWLGGWGVHPNPVPVQEQEHVSDNTHQGGDGSQDASYDVLVLHVFFSFAKG
jgi:hypothetical protein